MPMIASKLPRRLAVVGVVITFALAAMWWVLNAHNLLAGASSFLEGMTFIVCPPELPLGFMAMDMGLPMQLVNWALAAAINGALYYWLGWGIVALRERFRR